MKTKSLFVAVLFSVVTIASVIAADVPTSGMAVLSSKGSKVVRVIYKAENAGRIKLSIINSASKVVFSESRNTTAGFILPLNFTGLQYGEYTIQITDASGTKSEKFVYAPASSNAVHVSQLNAEGKFLLSVANVDSDDITVRVFDSVNNLVHVATQAISGDFAQVYVIKNYDGACRFEVSSKRGNTTTVGF
jgi:hypothetical protein